MGNFYILSEKEMRQGAGLYRLTFYLGYGLYQCFPSWRDFLLRDRDVDQKLSFIFEKSRGLDQWVR